LSEIGRHLGTPPALSDNWQTSEFEFDGKQKVLGRN
jgi:hypothetical protein